MANHVTVSFPWSIPSSAPPNNAMAPVSRGTLLWITAKILIGCCMNMLFLELVLKEVPNGAHLVTFVQHLVLAVGPLPRMLMRDVAPSYQRASTPAASSSGWRSLGWRLRPRNVPFDRYLLMVSLFFVSNLLNNLAFQYRISVPFQVVFRSASVATSLVLGVVILKRRRVSTSNCSLSNRVF